MGENQPNQENWKNPRFLIAAGVLTVSVLGVLVLSGAVLLSANEATRLDTAKTVLAAILPLLGTWVGTVLAYYFSKENFESANQNVREMVKLTSMEKLKAIRVSDVMIPISNIDTFEITKQRTEDKVLLMGDLLDLLEARKRNRLPILDENKHPKYVIHRSLIDRFLVEKSKAGMTPDDLKRQTLKNMVEDSSDEVKKFIRVSFGTVLESDTLADAKREMDREKGRLDVLVTGDGTPQSAVVGWVTNLIINEHARV